AATLQYKAGELDVLLYHVPVATPQSITLPDNGQTTITLSGTTPDAPSSSLVYTVTSLPSSGTLTDSNGAAVTLGESFVGNAAVLPYTLPTEVLGDLSTSFNFTATDQDDPAGSGVDQTSSPATIAIQTPAGSTGILRIGGTSGNDTITLSQTGASALHI